MQMKINSANMIFNGQLHLKNPDQWSEKMKQAVTQNSCIQEKLKNYDVIADLKTIIETKNPPFSAKHTIGDKLYKLNFTIQSEEPTFWEKLRNKLKSQNSKTYIINRHYHSEHTTVERIKNFKIE